jgi:hypothetical protein
MHLPSASASASASDAVMSRMAPRSSTMGSDGRENRARGAERMPVRDDPEVVGRLQRALETFQKAQGLLLTAHCRVKGLPAAEVEQFWTAQGSRIEQHLHATAVEVVASFRAFSAAGLVASADDRHLVNEAQRHLAEGGR